MDADADKKPWLAQVREFARLVPLALRLAWGAGPRLLLGLVALLFLQALLPTLDLVFAKGIVDRVVADLGGAEAPALAGRLPLAAWIGLAAGALALGQLLQPASTTFQSLIGDRLTGHVTEQLLRATNGWRGLARFEDPAFADDLRRARERASWGALHLLLAGCDTTLRLFTATGLVVTLARLHPLVPVVLVLASLPQIVAQWVYGSRTGNHLYDQTPDARRMEYDRDAPLAIEPAKDVRLFGLGPFFARRYDATFRRTIGGLDVIRRRLTPRLAIANALAAAAVAGVYLYVVRRVAGGALTVGDLALFGGAATLFQAQLLRLGNLIGFLPPQMQFLPSVFRIVDAPPDLPQPAAPRPAPDTPRDGVVFEGVGFAYPGGEPVLRDVSFALRPGQSLALVGHNGAGKTTIVKLLLRLYDPTAGRILLEGVDLREYDLDAVRARMAVVFQDFVRFDLTAAENIAAGDLRALDDEPRLLRAAAEAGAAELVAGLPQGLRTTLGLRFGERDLSTGEWQKLALARAFVRDAAILVLDEPTAALDVQTEHDVYGRFHTLTRGRATLLISHRFSTVRMADRILYLDDGRIAEEGDHAALMARDGEYARLYRLQAAQYAAGEEEEVADA